MAVAIGDWVACGLQAGHVKKIDGSRVAVQVGSKQFWRKTSEIRPLFGSSGRPKMLPAVGDWVRLQLSKQPIATIDSRRSGSSDGLRRSGSDGSLCSSTDGSSLSISEGGGSAFMGGPQTMGQVCKVDPAEGRLCVQLRDGRGCWRSFDQVVLPDDDAPSLPLQMAADFSLLAASPLSASSTETSSVSAASAVRDGRGSASPPPQLPKLKSVSSNPPKGAPPTVERSIFSASRRRKQDREGRLEHREKVAGGGESSQDNSKDRGEKSSQRRTSPFRRRSVKASSKDTVESRWTESIIRSEVLDAEAEKPGGLAGGPGEIRPADIHSLLESRWGRPLTKGEKKLATQRLSRNIMQLEPPSRISHNLFLGNAYNAVNFWEMKSLGITRVLNVCAEERFDPPEDSYASNGITCHRIPLTDQPSCDILPHFEPARAFLRASLTSGFAVLVHCEYGVSRSGTIALAFLMAEERLTLRQALEQARMARPQVSPNAGFHRALVHYEQRLFAPNALISVPSKGVAFEGMLRMLRGGVDTGDDAGDDAGDGAVRRTGRGGVATASDRWDWRWAEVRPASAGAPPCLLVYARMSEQEAMLSVPLEGVSVYRTRLPFEPNAWELCVSEAPLVFATENETDAERWVSACAQQMGCALADLTPRMSSALLAGGFMESSERGSILSAGSITPVKRLGAGFYGDVFEGTWHGARVALKFCSQDAATQLVQECVLHHKLDHPNVLRWHGICIGQPTFAWPTELRPPCMVVELARCGTFLQRLKETPRTRLYEHAYWLEVLSVLVGTAHGLAYLHSQRIMHRDLKADNLLLDERMQVKIADFGLSRAFLKGQQLRQSGQAGTYSHHAPEVLSGAYDLSADIFSVGIVITEAIAAREAQDIIDETRNDSFGLDEAGLRRLLEPERHPAVAFELVGLAVACCALEHTSRPAVTDCLSRLESMLVDLTSFSA